ACRPHDVSVGPDPRRESHALPVQLRLVHDQLLPLNFGNGKQTMNHGIQWKMKSSSATMIISRINAQSVMIGIESEQIIPMESVPRLHAPPPPTSRSLCSGHGSTERTRSPNPRP